MKNLIRLIRPKQWIKNLIVLPTSILWWCITTPISHLCRLDNSLIVLFAASSIYCLNDIIDIEDDKHHPIKCNRPLASGAISIPQGYTLMVLMLILSMASTFLLYDHQLETAGVIAFIGYSTSDTA